MVDIKNLRKCDCGYEPQLYVSVDAFTRTTIAWVRCGRCTAATGSYKSKDWAIYAWNTRNLEREGVERT